MTQDLLILIVPVQPAGTTQELTFTIFKKPTKF